MRTASNTDFQVDVDGMGRFTFARKQMRDIYAIRGEYAAATASNFTEEGGFADIGALAFVTVQRLLVAAPVGFNLDALDPLLDDDAESKIVKVFLALREKELSFRPRPQGAGTDEGQAAG